MKWVFVLIAFVVLSMPAASSQGFYDGKTVEIVVPYRNGGGTDGWARAVAPFLQQYLGDSAAVQVINEPGSSGIAGANNFAVRREHDGLSLLVSSGSNALPYVLGAEGVKYDFNDFTAITGSPVGGVVYTSPDTGITEATQLCNNDEGHLTARYFTPKSLHPTYAVSGAICTSSCAALPGAITDDVVVVDEQFPYPVCIEHPSGTIEIMLDLDTTKGQFEVISGGVLRTARRLFAGETYVPKTLWQGKEG